MNGAILQQIFVVEYIVQSQMCEDCHRVEAKDFWKAVVQVRQKVCICAYVSLIVNAEDIVHLLGFHLMCKNVIALSNLHTLKHKYSCLVVVFPP